MTGTTSTTATGNVYVDGIISGTQWATNSFTYSFPTSASFYTGAFGLSYGSGEPLNGFQPFTAIQQAAVTSILGMYSQVANLSFTEITETSTQSATLRYAELSLPSTAWTYYPSTSPEGGDAWFNSTTHWYDNPVVGNYAWLTMIHETGHAMGLKHPQEAGTYGAMPADHNSLEYTVMSYRSYVGASDTAGLTNGTWSFPTTLMMYDISALQSMYGANYSTNAGDTVYKWDPSTGQEFINGVAQAMPGGNKVFMTIWDGGGHDTYDFSNYTTGVTVNLAPGSWTTTSATQLANLGNGHTAIGNIANALEFQGNTASLIENAVGGTGNDTLIGNAANNTLTGGHGNDTLDGVSGTDTAVYSGKSTDYRITANADGSYTVTDLRSGSPDGTDTLRHIELAKFSDTTVTLGTATQPGIATPSIVSFSPDTGVVGDGITDKSVISLAGTADANSTIKIYDGATLLGSVTTASNGSWSFTTATLSDGTHAFTATATDSSGNTSATSTATNVTVDTVAPVVPTVSLQSADSGIVGDGITNANVVAINGVAEAGSTVRLYDNGVLVGTALANAAGTYSFTANPQSAQIQDDQAAAQATITNVSHAGNGSVLLTGTATPGETVEITDKATGAVIGEANANAHGEWIWTHEQSKTQTFAASVAHASGGGGTASGATANQTQAYNLSTGPLSDGVHNFTVTSTDAAGNVSTSNTLAVRIDTTAPVAPSIVSFGPDSGIVGDGITNHSTLTLTGSAEANSTVKVYDGTTLLGTATANGTGAWSLTTGTLANGAHNLTATSTDVAGNTSAASGALQVTVDTIAPVAPSIASFGPDSGIVGDGITNHSTLTLTGSAEANSTVKVYDGTTLLGTATANGTGAWSLTTGTLANGAHNLTATSTDVAGNTSGASSVLPVTVDTSAPVVPSIASFGPDSGTVGDGITNHSTLTLTGSAEANSTVKVYDGTTLLGTATANGTGAWSLTTGTLADGAHNLSATATDVAGNTSGASSVLPVTVDTSAPVAPSIVSFGPDSGTVGDGITNASTLTLTGSAEANSTVKVYDGTTLLGTATANGTGAWSLITGTLANGAHNLSATATDVAGNTSGASSALQVTIQSSGLGAPTITSFGPDSGTVGDGITNHSTLTLTGSAEANSTVKVYDGTTLLGTTTANGTGAWSLTTGTLADGAHNLTATSTDVAGNTSGASSVMPVTVDTSAPVAPSIASFGPDSGPLGDGITNHSTLTLTGSAEANSTVKVYDGTTLLGTATANGTGAWSLITGTLADGAHNLTATSTDVADNTSAASGILQVAVDTSAPVAPSIISFGPDSGTVGDGITNASTLTLTGSAEANSTVNIYDGTILLGTATANGTGAWSLTTGTLADGTHNLSATATDVAGNTSGASSVLQVTIQSSDLVVPTITSFGPDSGIVGDGITNHSTLTLTGSAEANSTVKVYDGTTLLGTATANGTGAWSLTTGTLANGAHNLTATSTDVAGNTSAASGALQVTVDTIAPVAPSIASFGPDSGIVGDGITNHSTLTLTGSAEANSTVKVYDGTTLLGTATANGTGAWSLTTGTLANGAHNLTATSTDVAGNTSGASSVLPVTVDTSAPVVPSIASFGPDSGTVGDGITNHSTLTLTGSAEANSTVKVYDGTTLLGTATANGTGAWSLTTGTLADGAHNLSATATDVAGNTSGASSVLPVTVDTSAPVAPSIVSFGPDSGTVGDGITNASTLTLTGSAEANSTVKVYDGTTLLGTATANGTGAWSLITGTLANGAHNLSATATDVAGNTSGASSALQVTIQSSGLGAPTITSFGPDSGTVGDGITNHSTLTLTGSAEANSTVKVYDGTTLLGTTTANGTGAWSLTTGTLADGAHNLTATSTDVAGNTSGASSVMPVTVDTSAPVAPSIASFGPDSGPLGDGITNHSTLTLTGSAEANSTVKVYDGTTLLGTATANGTGAWSLITGTLADGAHNLTATSTDVADNTSAASGILQVAVDTSAPVAPSIISFGPDSGTVGDGITNASTLTLTGSAEANSTVNIYDGTILLGTATANGTGAWSLTTGTLADGTHNLSATATDVAGNVSSTSAHMDMTIDTAAPMTPTVASLGPDSGTAGDGITNHNMLTLTGSAEANSTVKVYDGTTLLGTASSNGTGDWSFTTGVLSDGTHAFSATDVDAAGNSSASSVALHTTIDTVAPNAPLINFLLGNGTALTNGVSSSNVLTLNGSAEANSTVKVYDGTTLLGSATTNGTGSWSFTTGSLSDGDHTFTATDTDVAANTSAHSSALSVNIDSQQSSVPISVFGFTTSQWGLGILAGYTESNGSVYITDSKTGMPYGYINADANGAWKGYFLGISNGINSFDVKAMDASGNSTVAHLVYGTAGNDSFVSTTNSETFTGSGGNDSFAFTGNFGHDIISDYHAASDVIQLDHSVFTDFASVLSHAAQVGTDVVITANASDSVTLHNATLSQLTTDHFHLV